MEDRTVFQPAPQGSVPPGAQLNGVYQIERLIAQGGMGEVYKGFNIQTGDPVAIKMILREMSENPDALSLFRREASTLHNLQHEAIVRYYVFSVDPGLKRAYLAMEFVDGPSLKQHLLRGPLTSDEADLFRTRLGSALGAAHRLGIVHRDISSDNFILPDADVRKSKLIDFGIARSRRPGEGTIIGGGFAGKYNYVSPEQLGLGAADVTFKSDIYSFGLVLAEALRGRPIDMGGTQVEIIEKRRKVPDLSDIPAPLRPLLQSMLQPDPAARPESMDAVAAWRPGAGRASTKPPRSSRPEAPDNAPSSGGGRAAAALGLVILLASVGGAGYVFRDDLRALLAPATAPSPSPIPSLAPTSSPPPLGPRVEPTPATPPPLASPEATTAPSPAASQSPTQTLPASPSPAAPTPNLPDLFADLPPKAAQALVELPPARVGSPYSATTPRFGDPTGKGLALTADPAPPPGLAFRDAGDGVAEISGNPSQAGAFTLHITATTRKGRAANMLAALVIEAQPTPAATPPAPPPVATPSATPTLPAASAATASPTPAVPSVPAARPTPPPAPPLPSQASVTLDPATAGIAYAADLPPFRGGGGARELVLHPEPNPPEGVTFVDLGGGFSQLSGAPAKAGAYAFDIVAVDANGKMGRMAVRLTVAPAPAVAPAHAPAAAPARLDPSAFLASYDGGACFLARPNADDGRSLTGIGANKADFARFDAAYRRDVGAEPLINAKLIAAAQCSVLELVRLADAGRAPAPHVDLVNVEVGTGRPLAGAVRGVAGRKLALIAIDNDGVAHRLPYTLAAGGDAASFSVNTSGDADSIGPLQMLLVLASDAPFAAMENFRSMSAVDLSHKLAAEWPVGKAAAALEFFRLTK